MTLPTTFDSNYLLALGLVGALIPAAIAVVNQRDWSSETKGLAAALCCLLAAVLLAYTQGVLDPGDVLRSALVIFTLAQLLYATFWRPSGLADVIERTTSVR